MALLFWFLLQVLSCHLLVWFFLGGGGRGGGSDTTNVPFLSSITDWHCHKSSNNTLGFAEDKVAQGEWVNM